MMAGLDGYEMLLKIKEIEGAKDIPIVVLTNRTSLNEGNSKIKDLDIAAFHIKSDTSLAKLVLQLADVIENNKV